MAKVDVDRYKHMCLDVVNNKLPIIAAILVGKYKYAKTKEDIMKDIDKLKVNIGDKFKVVISKKRMLYYNNRINTTISY